MGKVLECDKPKSKFKTKCMYYILFALILTLFAITFAKCYSEKSANKPIRMNSGWNIVFNGEKYEKVSLDNFRIKTSSKGDTFSLKNVVPNDVRDKMVMKINMVFCETHVYVDGQEVYSYGEEQNRSGDVLGYGIAFFDFPDNMQGKEIEITFNVTENDAFSSITPPEFYSGSSAVKSLISNQKLQFSVDITLAVVGIVVTAIIIVFIWFSEGIEKLLCIGAFSLLIGVWSLCSNNFFIVFTDNLVLKIYFEYLSLFLAPLPVMLYFREDVINRNSKIENIIFRLYIIVEILLFIVAIILNEMNILHFPGILWAFQLLIALGGIFVIYLMVRDMFSFKNHKILFLGLLLVVLVAMRDLIAFWFDKYFSSSGVESDYCSYIAIGAMLFVISMIIDFIMQIKQKLSIRVENTILERIANEDVLTGLASRRHMEDCFDELADSTYEYCIIELDLNDLKKANDNYGHDEGDRLLKGLAECLKLSFRDTDVIARMGGDEFAVLIRNSESMDVDGKIELLRNNIEKANEEARSDKVKISCAIGYAKSSQFSKPVPRDVYQLADTNMYVEKRAYHANINN